MFKKLIAFSLISLFSLNVFAQNGETEFTYAQGSPYLFGKSKREVIDVAMCIDEPSYAGMKLTKIKAYISTSQGISKTSIWLSKELTLNNSVNVPDIASFNVTPIEGTLESMNLSLLEITLDQPYILTAEPLYVGYSMTVDQNTTDEQKKPVIIADNINPNGMFLHMSKSVMKWMDYSERAGGVAYIIATLEGELPDYSLDILGNEIIFAENNKDFQASFTVSNKGVETIDNLNYMYSYDNGEEYEGYYELFSKIEPGIANYVNISLPFKAIDGAGPHTLDLVITKVNGEPNMAVSPSITSRVNVMPFIPVHRPLVEEFTGLWCGWCPRGYIAMEMIAKDFANNQVSICYHSGDPMEVTNETPIPIPGLPKSCIDRISGIDPYYGNYSDTEFGISIDLQNRMDELAFADIQVSSNFEDGSLNVTSEVQFILDLNDTDYEIGYVLVCNGLSDKSWMQDNYYAGGKLSEDSPLYVLTTWPEYVLGLVFNDVAVDTSAMMGIEGSLPSDVETAKVYTNNYSFDIQNNSLIQNKDNLVVTAFIIDKKTGRIVNANKCKINGKSGINAVESGNELLNKEFYDMTGRKVASPSSGIYILKENFSNGSSKTSKVYIR